MKLGHLPPLIRAAQRDYFVSLNNFKNHETMQKLSQTGIEEDSIVNEMSSIQSLQSPHFNAKIKDFS